VQGDERAEEVDAWLSRARSDVRAARVLVAADPALLGNAAFHCQQAVEKALKALLTHHDHVFQKTHDIGVLAKACATYEPGLRDLLRSAAPFTEYAWRFRYPGEIFEPPVEEVGDAMTIGAEVVEAVASRVGSSMD
jgi:HEPN domain-containing protein